MAVHPARVVGGLLLLGFGAAAAAPKPGRYDVELCVATRPSVAATCGPAVAVLRKQGDLDVRVADVVYTLHLGNALLGVTTRQDRVQIDAFEAPYDWAGDTLRFTDAEKNVRYEVRFGARRPAGR